MYDAIACKYVHSFRRHDDALQLKEETLAFHKRILPSDHPDIAMSMNNLATTYTHLGRHDDALRLNEETLAFRKRILPSDHPYIAMSMNNLASTYSHLGRHDDALRLKEETLAFLNIFYHLITQTLQ